MRRVGYDYRGIFCPLDLFIGAFIGQATNIDFGGYVRGHPFSTFAKILGFLTPSLPVVRISRNLSVLLYTKIGHFINTPLPLGA